MAEKLPKSHHTHLQNKRLSITRETELLQSFVRISVADDDNEKRELRGVADADIKKDSNKTEEIQPQDQTENKDKDIPEKKKQAEDGTNATEEVKRKVKKRRRRTNKREELYCDKDRAAAANMGSKDIKHSLRIKRKQDRTKALQIPEEAEPGTFLALGNYEMGRGDLQIALDFMTKALELNPAEKNSLVARSKCYILLGQPENALKDAETALNIDKSFLKAIYQKAESLYYLGDFEHSLMYFHRGLHVRPDQEDFKLGVHKAQKAIENAIGSPFIFSRFLASRSSAKSKLQEHSKSINSPTIDTVTVTKVSSQKKTPTSRTKSRPKSRLLRELGPDKEYLDNLMKNPNLKCKFREEDSTIVRTIEETVEYLNARQEFWRQQLPAHLKI